MVFATHYLSFVRAWETVKSDRIKNEQNIFFQNKNSKLNKIMVYLE